MPRGKKIKDEDEDFELYEDGGDDNSDGEEDFQDDEPRGVKNETEVEEQEKADLQDAKPPAPAASESKSSTRRKKKKRRIQYKNPEIDHMTSQERKTSAGGYSHTNKSKEKISKANAGNVPWNKGKERSSADKAKIKAGVQARNRAIKLERLRRLGMSEEDFDQKKKEIKYLRERVRRTKLTNDRHAAKEAQKKLQEAIDATTDKGPKIKVTTEQIEAQMQMSQADKAKHARLEAAAAQRKREDQTSFMATDFAWSETEEYPKKCPQGGPGGMVCCPECFSSYQGFLNKTIMDMEVQRTHKVGKEVRELMNILASERGDLDRVAGVARRKAPPARRLGTQHTRPATSARNQANQQNKRGEDIEWSLTSTIDIVNPPTKTASV